MRSNVSDVQLLLLALSLGSVVAQSAPARASGARPLPQWLTGIIAVVGFLFLSFVVFLVKRAWCEKPKERGFEDVETKENEFENVTENGRPGQRRDSTELKTYMNFAMDYSEDKVTAM